VLFAKYDYNNDTRNVASMGGRETHVSFWWEMHKEKGTGKTQKWVGA
jgi:hypothetical protein